MTSYLRRKRVPTRDIHCCQSPNRRWRKLNMAIALSLGVTMTNAWADNIFVDSGQRMGTEDTRAVPLGDVDNDGDLDIYFANYQARDELWLNDGTGTFSKSSQTLSNIHS